MSPAVLSTAYIVDDDEAMRTLWRWLMESNAIPVQTYATAAGFIAAYRRDDPGCLILDLKLPGMSGLELQDYLKREGIEIPIVFVTGHADVPTAVSALKRGAVDFIQKPFGYREVVAVIGKAFARDTEIREARVRQALIASRIAALTERERDVLRRIIEGKQNKIIASELEISVKTVEVHRAKVMEKMRADSVAELVQCMLGFSLMEAPGPGS